MAQKRSGRQKKLGLAIVAIAIAAILVTAAASTIVTVLMFKSYNDSILV